jgi:hypothetical protein
MTESSDLTIDEVVDEIIRLNFALSKNWKRVGGWAPPEAARLLDESRLDWLVSLSHTLRLWIVEDVPSEQFEGSLILSWANLGALVEGSMKFFLSVYASNYADAVTSKNSQAVFKKLWDGRRAEPKGVDGLMLDVLREFFRSEVWLDVERAKWDTWVAHIRNRRNTIHAFKDRELGTFDEFVEDLRTYLEFLDGLVNHLPDLPSYGS